MRRLEKLLACGLRDREAFVVGCEPSLNVFGSFLLGHLEQHKWSPEWKMKKIKFLTFRKLWKSHLEHHVGTFTQHGLLGRVDRNLLRKLCIELWHIVFASLLKDFLFKKLQLAQLIDGLTRTGLIGGSRRRSKTSFQLTFLKKACDRTSRPSPGPLPNLCPTWRFIKRRIRSRASGVK